MRDAPETGLLAGRRVLVCVTGGIAAYKAVHLIRLLTGEGADVRVAMTEAATRFVGPATFAALSGQPVATGIFEDPAAVTHVLLPRDADVAVVAPATANSLAKVAVGFADDVVAAALLEARCPIVVAPAMHPGMWSNPATVRNLDALRERGYTVVGPAEGPLAAGDAGVGRMAEPEEILAAVISVLHPSDLPLAGRRILVTAGPTHEPVDAVRFLGNRSSGRMGFAVAVEAARRGGEVTLVTGPVALGDPPGVTVVRVETAAEMLAAVEPRYDDADVVVMAAAVADFRPAHPSAGKLKKDAGPPPLALERTVDILATLGKRKQRQVLVGFAAETDDLEREGRRKLDDKNLDLMVVNRVGAPGTGFGAETNDAMLLSRGGEDVPMRRWTKPELAGAICDRMADALGRDAS